MGKRSSRRILRIGVAVDLMAWSLRRHTDIFAGIARYAEEQPHWRYVVDDFAADTMLRPGAKSIPYDGVIGAVTPQLAKAARRCRIPVVNVWANSTVQGLVSVFPDYEAVGKLVAEHLLSRGVRRFMCLLRRRDVPERLVGESIRTAVLEEGGGCELIRVSPHFEESLRRWNKAREVIEGWIERATCPVGVFAGLDEIGRHVAEFCSSHDLRVPQDVAIVAGHNEPTRCLYPKPTLTSIEYGYDRVGYEAARIMNRMLDGQAIAPKTIRMPPRELVVRGSSDSVYVDEEVVSTAVQYIIRHARHAIRVEDVAMAAQVSRRTLEYRFEKHLNRTVAAEIRRTRLEHANRLLSGAETSISEIARLSGFGTSQNFSRVFRRETGTTPREYRSEYSGLGGAPR